MAPSGGGGTHVPVNRHSGGQFLKGACTAGWQESKSLFGNAFMHYLNSLREVCITGFTVKKGTQPFSA